jgi:hypothetical protein
MTYTQYRLAKRNGVIIQQKRSLSYGETRKVYPWWKFWNQEYTYDTIYGEWEDIEIPEVAI